MARAISRPPSPAAKSEIKRERFRLRIRQVALFAAILITGGLSVIPREPLLLLVLVACFWLVNPMRMFKAEFAGIWILLAATIAAALIGGQSFQLGALAIRFSNFLAGIALLMVYIDRRPGTIASDLLPIFRFFGVQAVLTPILALLVAELFWTFNIENTTYHTLLYVFTYHEFVDTGAIFKRPDGFFFEPGVLQIYLNAYLFIALFLRRFSIFDVGLAALAVVATQSTTGAVILVLQVAVAYFRWLQTAERVQKLAVVIIAPLVLLPVAGYTTYNLAEKFYGQFSGSAEAREYDLRTGLNVVMEKPLTGIGFDYEYYFDVAEQVGYRDVELSRDNITERSNSNGIVTLLYSIGIPLSLVFLWGTARQRLFRPRWLFGALIFLSMTSEALFLQPFTLMVVFSGLLIPNRKGKARRTYRPSAGRPVRTQA
ncbi:MAG: O-antigen ligase family protein [Alteriqipengyuania sp.]